MPKTVKLSNPSNLDNLTLKQLEQLQMRVEKALAETRERERQDVIKKARKLVSDAGLDLKDLIPARRKHMPKKRIVNPANRSQSYGGYGPKPNWLKDLESKKAA